MTLQSRAVLAVVLGFVLATPAVAQQQDDRRAERFRGMDRNGDGIITRDEWRGNRRSFERHDWNNDGRLSGDELPEGARPQSDREPGAVGTSGAFSEWTEDGFRELDHNRDGRIGGDEWHHDPETFRRVDHDRNGWLSQREFLGYEADWRALGDEAPSDLFESLDSNRDGRVSASEWQWSRRAFDRRDVNRDGSLSRQEVAATRDGRTDNATADTPAYHAGYDRGLIDGRAAGRDDRQINNWDLDGQRELEQADAGYSPGVGARVEYQAGYREGFTRGYYEGFGRRQR